MRRLGLLATLLVALLFALPAYAADINGTLKGLALDTDGLPVPSAGVTLTSPSLLGARTTETDAGGRYRFPALPPGEYALKVEHPSFATYSVSGLRVELGATVSIDVRMELMDSGEVVEVRREVSAIDVENTSTGVVLDSEFLKDIPTFRDYQSAVTVAPGVLGYGNPNVQGSFYSSNQYYIDGVNTTDPLTGTFSQNMNYDAIESIEVITGGMDAEYGRALGGAVNIVTKSGGNDFEGQAMVVYSSPGMQHLAPLLEGDSKDENTAQQVVLNFGGPIVKDKVWFYLSAQGDRLISTTSYDPNDIPRQDIGGEGADLYPIAPRDWRSLYLFAKISAQPTPSHHLWVHAQADPTWISNTEQSPYVLPSAEVFQYQGGFIASAGHIWTPTSDLLVETQLYGQNSNVDVYSQLWRECKEWEDRICQDDFVGTEYMGQPVTEGWYANDADGFDSGEYPYASYNSRWRVSANTSVTWFADFLGEHELKGGAQFEYLSSYYWYPGIEDANGNGRPDPGEGFVYYEHDGDPTNLEGYSPVQAVLYENDWESLLTGQLGTVYLQDVWKPIRRLTIRPGVRLDIASLQDDLGANVFSRPTVAPRIGATFDLTGDGRTALHAHYGRFFDTGFLVVADLLRQRSQGYSAYAWDDRSDDWDPDPLYSVGGSFLQHDDMRNPYQDAFNVGIGRDLGGGFGLDGTFIYKESRRFWEDDETNLIWNDEGTAVVGYRNGTNEALYRLRTPDESYTRYTSIEVVASKRFGENWGFLASYTWSRAYGSQSRDQASANLDIPQQRDEEIGLLSYDRSHAIKISGSWAKRDLWTAGIAQGGFVLGWNAQWMSGRPYTPLVWNEYYSGYSNFAEPRSGRYRLPQYGAVDLRGGLTFDIRPTRWMLGVDFFNVFNDRTVTGVNAAFDPEATQEDGSFGDVTSRQGPRNMQVVLRGEF